VPHRLAGNPYRDFLLYDLPKLLQDVQLAVRARLWFMHDGAPTPSSRAVRDVPSDTSHDRWIGRGGHTAWLPQSPDVNPRDLYLWDT
jgi:hypothetical protein